MKTALQGLPEALLPFAGLAGKAQRHGLAVKTKLVYGLVHQAARRLRES